MHQPVRFWQSYLLRPAGQILPTQVRLAAYHSHSLWSEQVTSSDHWHGARRHLARVAFQRQRESATQAALLVARQSAVPHEPDLENHSH